MRTIFAGSLFIMLLCTGCAVNEWDVNRYLHRFETNKEDFEALVSHLRKENIKVGYAVNINQLPEHIREALNDLDISAIALNVTHCQGVSTYEFTTSWSSKATVYISKDECNKEQYVKGLHTIVSQTIEVWGLGDDWIMLIDHDFI